MDTSIWDEILSRIEAKVNQHSFYTWFKPTALIADGGQTISVRVPNALFKEWLTKHYSLVLSEALAEVGRADSSVAFVPDGAAADHSEPLEPATQTEAEPEE
ncbi:MAG TPA: DnaA N-terminal domain-containing protein, partial [Vicinamibacterales bacterium]|nr:DnaA N-terminal domain-containing protein [Vicinamibacterales bacterium]